MADSELMLANEKQSHVFPPSQRLYILELATVVKITSS